MTDDSNRDFSGAVNQSPGMNEREGVAALLDKHVDGVRHYLHLQIGKPLSKDLIGAPEIALDNLHRELREALRAAAPQEDVRALEDADAYLADLGIPEDATIRSRIQAALLAIAALAAPAPSAWQPDPRTVEQCAKVLDAAAQDWSRIRDPGMANNARSYATKIRALALPSSDRGGVG